ncbi:MAG: hypothetical protein ACLS69_04305 [Butyricicoccus sp.]
MLNKPQLLRRLLALCGLLLLCSGVALSQLFQLQILNGEKYVRRSAEFLTTTSTVSAARGEILDRYGRPLVTNNTGFSLVLIYSSFWDGNDKRFDTLLDLTHRIQTAAVDATAKQNAAKTAAAIPRVTPLRMPQTARIRPRHPDRYRAGGFWTRRRFRPSTTGCRSRSPRRSPKTAHR